MISINNSQPNADELNPDLTPLLDIIFIVMVFLLLTATVKIKSLDVELPQTSTQILQTTKEDPITINLVATEPYWALDGQSFDNWNNFSQQLLTAVKAHSDKPVVIGADNAEINGFTITGGTLAGIYCYKTSPTITNCVIQYNTHPDVVESEGYYWADGIRITGEHDIQTSPMITNNIIRCNNNGISYIGIYSFANCSPIIKNNLICDSTYWGGIFFGGLNNTEPAKIYNNAAGYIIHDGIIDNSIITAGLGHDARTFII